MQTVPVFGGSGGRDTEGGRFYGAFGGLSGVPTADVDFHRFCRKRGQRNPLETMIKKQQMRWNRWTLQPFLDVRVAVLIKTLAGSFKRLNPDFQTDNDNHAVQLAA